MTSPLDSFAQYLGSDRVLP